MIYRDDCLEQDSCQIRIRAQEPSEYSSSAAEINRHLIDVVSLQHEFGIFGGPDGVHVLDLVRNLRPPVVTTLHTIYPGMPVGKEAVLRELVVQSKHLVVLTEESKHVLVSLFGVPESKITVIHHGIPETVFRRPNQLSLRRTLGSGPVFVSAGHVKPKKGYDISLRALAQFRRDDPTFKYLIIGSSQAQFDRGNCYETQLKCLIEREGLEENVIRINKYLSRDDFIQNIQAADIGLVTYTMAGQNSSGILPLILGCGRPVVATEFEYARSIATRAEGVLLAKINDADAVYTIIRELVKNPKHVRTMMFPIYRSTPLWEWRYTACQYMQTYQAVAAGS